MGGGLFSFIGITFMEFYLKWGYISEHVLSIKSQHHTVKYWYFDETLSG